MTDKSVKIFKGKSFSTKNYKFVNTVIAFDLDETLGSFTDLEILWNSIHIFDSKININFNDLLDIYPEFLRYGILSILEYLYNKKRAGLCDNIYIYTNNQCNKPWVMLISEYFNYKIGAVTPIFDKIIYAFKINNIPVEFGRTSHEKLYSDFIKCTLLPDKTKICFVDNTYFHKMNNSRVYYIQPKSYIHPLTTSEIIERFSTSSINKNTEPGLNEFLFNQFYKKHNTSNNFLLKKSDIYVSQKLMYHIKEFFYLCRRKKKTQKHRFISSKFTRKLRTQ